MDSKGKLQEMIQKHEEQRKSNENLSSREIKELMGANRPTYQRKRGRIVSG